MLVLVRAWKVMYILIIPMQHLLLPSRVHSKSNSGRYNRLAADCHLTVISPEGEARGDESIRNAYIEWVAGKLYASIRNA